MERLARVWLNDAQEQARVEKILQVSGGPEGQFALGPDYAPDGNWLLGNAFEIGLPGTMFEVTGAKIPAENAWRWLRELVKPHSVTAGLFKGTIIAMGRRSDAEACFTAISGTIREVQCEPGSFVRNSALYAAVLDALVSALQGKFRRLGNYLLGDLREKTIRYSDCSYRYIETVHLSLERTAGKDYLAMQLDVELLDDLHADLRKAVKREILWRQRNREYFEKLKWWKEALFPAPGNQTFRFPALSDDGARFHVNSAGPIVARMSSSRPKPVDEQLARKMRKFERFRAVELAEPYLNFADGKAIHPIRGLVANGGPFDAADPTLFGDRAVRIGVICSVGYERRMLSLLKALSTHNPVGPAEADREYLVDYPGFANAFRCPLRSPDSPDDSHWRTLPKIDVSQDPLQTFDAIISVVRRAVDELVADGQVDVILIHVSPEWRDAERISNDGVTRDLHDYIKALCIQRGVRTQLIRDEKLAQCHDARLNWWLSLALYAKALRTPWSLDLPSRDVAYVGIGYSYSSELEGDPVVLGCSHVFDSTGLGLRFRLGKLKKPIWKATDRSGRRSPYMSRDDASLLGNRTRQLFYEIHQKLPERVLVTKRTPFLRTERDGILAALADVPQVDLVTVEVDDSWRFCAYQSRTRQAHGFPTRRGSAVLLDGNQFLLWLHGSVMEVVPGGMTYYLGKSRIPTPVRITRFAGESDLQTIATDLLALTKMDWNTFALYKKLPVTVTSPGVIARIGRLIPSTTAESYDYRLFM